MKLLIAGTPCTFWSVARRPNSEIKRETTCSGFGWELFENFLIAKDKFNPDYFLLENNQSISKEIKDEISNRLGVDYIMINSSRVSAQNRKRCYWTNIPNICQPEDENISFQDIKDSDFEYCSIFKLKNTPSRVRMWNGGNGRTNKYGCKNITHASKTGTVATKQDRAFNAGLIEFDGFARYLTINEQEKLQTLPSGYTKVLNKRTDAEKVLGNCWTASVITSLLKNIECDKDELLNVLSLYDGISVGRYCLEKLGYTHIRYDAYEIDNNAIKVSIDNYPDINQRGDAFDLRKDEWEF